MALVDNDVAKKIAILDLLEEFHQLPAVGGQALLLPTARFKFKATSKDVKKLREAFGDDAATRVVGFMAQQPTYPTDIALRPEFAGVEDIDVGEAGLFSAAVELPEHQLLTGDKRSIKALATASQCAEVAAPLAGRVMCFEQVMWAIVMERGLPHVWARCENRLGCDGSLRAIFSGGHSLPDANHVREGFRNYISALRHDAGALLHPLQP